MVRSLSYVTYSILSKFKKMPAKFGRSAHVVPVVANILCNSIQKVIQSNALHPLAFEPAGYQ
jgi:hypothetical protein